MKESFIGLVFFALALFPVSGLSAATVPKVYICPNCGCPNDNQAFDKPGRCPGCGMQLIERTNEPVRPQTTVAVLLFDGVQIIDYAGPWEAFGEAGFKVFTVAEKTGPIHAVYGQTLVPDYTFANAPRADILLVPGGGGTHSAVQNDQLLKWVRERSNDSQHVLSVCTGAFILAHAGLLDGLSATTVSGALDQLQEQAPKTKVVHDQRYVDNGKIITSAGLSSGIDGAFHLISKIRGRGTAQNVALGMEYRWDPDSKFARAALADRYLPDVEGVDAEILSTEGDRERWKVNVLFTKPNTPADVVELFSKRIVTATPHARGEVRLVPTTDKQSDTHREMRWEFSDEQGKHWAGHGVADTDAQPGKVQLTVQLEQSAG